MGALISYMGKGRRTLEWAKVVGEDSTKALLSLRSNDQEEDRGQGYDFDEFFDESDERFGTDEEGDFVAETSQEQNSQCTLALPSSGKRKRGFQKDEEILESLLVLVRQKRPDLLELDTNGFFLEFFRLNNILLDAKKLDSFITTVKKILFAEWKDLKFHEKVIEMSKNPFVFNNRPCYYSIDYSYWLLLRLLKSQYQIYDDCRQFIDNCINWANFESPKKNILYFIGPPGSGKSYFADTIQSIMWLVGTMKQLNKNTGNFFLDSCIYKVMGLWEEPNVSNDGGFKEILKRLGEGAKVTANVKFVSEGRNINQLPILITTNFEIWERFPEEKTALLQRMHHYCWSQQPWLINCTAFPHPLVWQKLLLFNEIDYALISEESDFNDIIHPDIWPISGESKFFNGRRTTPLPNNLYEIFESINKTNKIF